MIRVNRMRVIRVRDEDKDSDEKSLDVEVVVRVPEMLKAHQLRCTL